MTSIEIAHISSHLPICSPNLMPFHIDHSGPAPIETYFRVKKAGLQAPNPGSASEDLEAVASTPTTMEGVKEPGQIEKVTMDIGHTTEPTTTHSAEDSPVIPITPTPTSLKERFVAAFRGRVVHGATVELPAGYGGIVLRGGEMGKSTMKSMRRRVESAKRATRRPPMDEDELMDADETPVRTLNPSATFSSFVLWNADNPVDEGRDEYLRSMTEWTRLATEARL